MIATWQRRSFGLIFLALLELPAACQVTETEEPAVAVEAPAKAPSGPRFPIAVFALGDFWKAEARFGGIPGVVFTEVGYTGGTTAKPSYDNIGDHVQALRVAYDPKRVTYKQLLNAFWNSHNPVDASIRREYQCIIFYGDDDEQRLAEESWDVAARALKEGRLGRGGGFVLKVTEDTPLRTRVQKATRFFPAERLHQKYRLQQFPFLCQALQDLQPRGHDLLATTIAVRFNAFAGGQMTAADLREQARDLARNNEENKRYQEIIDALTQRRR